MLHASRFCQTFVSFVLCLSVAVVVSCQGSVLTGAKLYLKQGQQRKAEELLLLALSTEPNHPEIHFLLGQVYAEKGEFARMSESFDRSLQLSDQFQTQIEEQRHQYWVAFYNKGVGHATAPKTDYVAAAASFEVASTIDPERLDAWRNLAFSHYRAAVKAYEIVTTAVPEDTAAHNSLGVLYLGEGNYQAAESAFGHLLELNPHHVGALTNLSAIYMEASRYAEAEEAYGRAIHTAPDIWLDAF